MSFIEYEWDDLALNRFSPIYVFIMIELQKNDYKHIIHYLFLDDRVHN